MEAGLDLYRQSVVKLGLYSSEGNLRHHLDKLFDGVDFAGKSMLDIGGGGGTHSYYAACRGARRVLCLEPEAEGHVGHANDSFEQLGRMLGRDNAELRSIPLQALQTDEQFDVVLLHNSVNHLDEPACVTLLDDAAARASYRAIFARLAALTKKGGRLILCDATRSNFYALLGLTNPFSRTIEWDKHQAPETWAGLLEEVGFGERSIGWWSPNRLGAIGDVLLANRAAAYFLKSEFWLKMQRL